MQQCSHTTCFVPDTGCGLGHLDLDRCPSWTKRPTTEAEPAAAGDDLLLPWSGSAFGLGDLAFVSGRARPMVVGIAGPENAGKTTLLAAWYLLLGRGVAGLAQRQFAGSFTLDGWEAVAGSLRWTFAGQPTFPAHTTSRSGRAPGLLHLAFLNQADGRTTDLLLTDAPGEWFQRWALNRDASDAEGARWVSDRADVLLLVADREALAGPSKGSARGALQILAHRIGAEQRGRPVALVWTKADAAIAPEMEAAVREAVMASIPDAVEFSTSVISQGGDAEGIGLGFVELLAWIVQARRPRPILAQHAAGSEDPLFLYGGRSA